MSRLGAVVVNYRSIPSTLRCATQLLEQGVDEVVVVDNEGGEECVRRVRASVPAARVIVPGVNLGYGAAVNRGVAVLGPDIGLILVCNPDVDFDPGSVERLAQAFSSHEVAVTAPRLRDAEGQPYPSARRFPDPLTAGMHALVGLLSRRNRFSRRYRMEDGSLDLGEGPSADIEVDWVSGACMMVRREAFEALGGFDEAFFMYVEDVDLCRRARMAGYSVKFVPGAEVAHEQGVSTASRAFAMTWQHHRSAMLYARRTLAGRRRLLLPFAYAVLVTRFAAEMARKLASEVPGSRSPSGAARRC